MRECDYEARRLLSIGYKQVIDHPKQFISPYGVVVDTFSGPALRVQVYVDRAGNHIVTLKDDDGWWNNFEIGMLVALHFIRNPYGRSKIRHLDGNKSNNRVENIVWSSLNDEEYLEYIYKTKQSERPRVNCGGAQTSHKVYCKETDETYDSIGIAARELCLDSSDLAKTLKHNDGVCRCKDYNVCYDELKDEVEFEEEVYFGAVNQVTHEDRYYDSIRQAARDLGINRRTLTKYIDSGKPVKGWIVNRMK